MIVYRIVYKTRHRLESLTVQRIQVAKQAEWIELFLAHSKNELMRWRGVCRSSVCLSVCVSVCKHFCGNRSYDAKNSSIATKLAQDGQQVGAHPSCAQGRGQGQRSRDTSAFVPKMKIASCRRQMAGLRPNLHTMVSRPARVQNMVKVKFKVKGHVLEAVLRWHEKRFSSEGNGRIATKLAHDGLQVSLHPGCAQGQGQGQRSRDTGTIVLDLKSLFLAHK